MKINTSIFKKEHEYTPVIFRDEINPPIFNLQTLSVKQLSTLDDMLTKVNKDETISIASGTHALNALKMSLKGWQNITDEKDKNIVFKMDGTTASDESIELLPSSIRTELSNYILTVSRFPEEAEKNLKKH